MTTVYIIALYCI